MAATIGVTTVLCARIYWVGILMYGNWPSLREVASGFATLDRCDGLRPADRARREKEDAPRGAGRLF